MEMHHTTQPKKSPALITPSSTNRAPDHSPTGYMTPYNTKKKAPRPIPWPNADFLAIGKMSFNFSSNSLNFNINKFGIAWTDRMEISTSLLNDPAISFGSCAFSVSSPLRVPPDSLAIRLHSDPTTAIRGTASNSHRVISHEELQREREREHTVVHHKMVHLYIAIDIVTVETDREKSRPQNIWSDHILKCQHEATNEGDEGLNGDSNGCSHSRDTQTI